MELGIANVIPPFGRALHPDGLCAAIRNTVRNKDVIFASANHPVRDSGQEFRYTSTLYDLHIVI